MPAFYRYCLGLARSRVLAPLPALEPGILSADRSILSGSLVLVSHF